MALFLISVWMRAFFDRLAQDLAQLASLVTITTIIINRDIKVFFNLKVFLVFKVSLYQFVATRTTSITLLNHRHGLIGLFYFSIDIFFNDLLPIINILIFFVKIELD